MSKALKKVGVALGAVALIATGVGAIGGLGLIAAATATTIGTIAGVASGIASIGSQVLAKPPQPGKPPPARGSVSQMIIAPDPPQPYVMGEGYFAGILRHRAGYGGVVDEVRNPYLFDAVVYSGGGPVESLEPRLDYAAIPAWYTGYLFTDVQLGATPEADSLSPEWAGTPGWDADSKLSGQAAIGWSYKFDKAGKKFTNGFPLTGGYGQWVKVYDPRKDSTFPGGSGSHRLNDETTWEWSEIPALHAGTYAYGRYQNGKRVLGIGLAATSINWEVVAAWANLCELNEWTMFGVVFEPGDKWANLKDICAAGGGEPIPGPVLSFRYHAPAVSLDTVYEVDIADEESSVCAMQSYRDRINEVRPVYRSPDHNWELIQADAVTVPTYVTEDGEVRPVEWPFNFVKNANQAAQLAAYKLVDARELHPIEITCKPRMRGYRPGDCLHLDLPQLGLDHDAIVLHREIDPATMKVRLTLMSETTEKHAYALGETTTPPPTPALIMNAQERDETAWGSFPTPDEMGAATPADVAAALAEALAAAEARGKLFVQATMPTLVESNPGDTWVDDQGIFYDRVYDGGILLGGFAITLAGFRPFLAWTLSAVQPLAETIALAEAAYESANDAIDQLIGLADDGILSRNEKITKLIPESARLETKWNALGALATSLSVSTAAASSARSAWLAFLTGLSPAWNNTDFDTAVSRSAYDAARDTYDAALYNLDRDIKDAAKSLADAAQSTANTALSTANTTATNFNSRNDRIATAVVVPTIAADGTAVDHAINPGGSADLSFEWSWGGTEAQIDGFEVLVYSSTSSSAYTPNTTPAAELTFFMAANKRAFILFGTDPTLYYTFAVRAYRIVDPDIDASGILRSVWVKPSLAAENPYRPASTVAFAGNVTGTVDGEAAAAVADGAVAANNGLNSDGTVKPTRVDTGAIVTGAVNKLVAAYSASASGVAPNTSAQIITVSLTNCIAGSSFLVHGGARLGNRNLTDPISNHTEGLIWLEYRVNGGSWTQDSLIGNDTDRFWSAGGSPVLLVETMFRKAVGLYTSLGQSDGHTVDFRVMGQNTGDTSGQNWRYGQSFLIATEIKR